MRRLESIASSPVYALISEALAGLATIRSLGTVRLFEVRTDALSLCSDSWTEADHPLIALHTARVQPPPRRVLTALLHFFLGRAPPGLPARFSVLGNDQRHCVRLPRLRLSYRRRLGLVRLSCIYPMQLLMCSTTCPSHTRLKLQASGHESYVCPVAGGHFSVGRPAVCGR